MSLLQSLRKSLFSPKTLFKSKFKPLSFSSASKPSFPSYKRPKNHLNVSDFIEKFKDLSTDIKDEKVTLTGTIFP